VDPERFNRFGEKKILVSGRLKHFLNVQHRTLNIEHRMMNSLAQRRRLRRVVIPAKAGIQKSKLDAPGLRIAGAGLSSPA
jgi:hypothetical protein